ncbi:hypothetical protein PC116_g18601 [Phytophthora cactorum]|nr:hypothetical protein PC116_g18601 [Phytophthora cactorum]
MSNVLAPSSPAIRPWCRHHLCIIQRCLIGTAFDDASCAVSCCLSFAVHRFPRLPTSQSSAPNDINIQSLDPMGATGRSRILLPCDFKCRVTGHSRGGTGTKPETVATVLTRDWRQEGLIKRDQT